MISAETDDCVGCIVTAGHQHNTETVPTQHASQGTATEIVEVTQETETDVGEGKMQLETVFKSQISTGLDSVKYSNNSIETLR